MNFDEDIKILSHSNSYLDKSFYTKLYKKSAFSLASSNLVNIPVKLKAVDVWWVFN